jgi:hypothetical protein
MIEKIIMLYLCMHLSHNYKSPSVIIEVTAWHSLQDNDNDGVNH